MDVRSVRRCVGQFVQSSACVMSQINRKQLGKYIFLKLFIIYAMIACFIRKYLNTADC